MQPDKFVITIGRTYGSGGRLLGRMIAERLGIGFYDKQLLVEAAQKAGFSHAFVEQGDEQPPKMLGGIIPFSMGFYPMSWVGSDAGASTSDSIYKAQCDFMHELAERESCVIVGRSADYVLRNNPNVVNIFVHATPKACADRIVQRNEAANRQDAIALAERTNKLRANFYNFYTDKKWGDARSYHLCFDSEVMKLEDMTDLVIAYIQKRFPGLTTAK